VSQSRSISVEGLTGNLKTRLSIGPRLFVIVRDLAVSFEGKAVLIEPFDF
jgi:hypothetical protein